MSQSTRIWDLPTRVFHWALFACVVGLVTTAQIGGDAMPENWKEVADYLDVKTINLGSRLVTREIADDIMDLELPLLVYTVNDPMQARALQKLGVDAFFSDNPDILIENLAGGLN